MVVLPSGWVVAGRGWECTGRSVFYRLGRNDGRREPDSWMGTSREHERGSRVIWRETKRRAANSANLILIPKIPGVRVNSRTEDHDDNCLGKLTKTSRQLVANGTVKAATAMKQVIGGTNLGTNSTAPPVRLGFTFCGSCHHPTALRGQDNSPVRPQGGGVAGWRQGGLLTEPKKERNLASHGTPVGHLPISACPTARFRKKNPAQNFLRVTSCVRYVGKQRGSPLGSLFLSTHPDFW